MSSPPIQEPITDGEDLGDLSRPVQALAEFYWAFQSRDLGRARRLPAPCTASRVGSGGYTRPRKGARMPMAALAVVAILLAAPGSNRGVTFTS